jgi:hypothetical protein
MDVNMPYLLMLLLLLLCEVNNAGQGGTWMPRGTRGG